jgi:hypothetical protein
MMFRVFWDVAPCSQVGVDRRFRGAYCVDVDDDADGDEGSVMLTMSGK